MKVLISRTNLWVAIVAFVLAWIPVASTCAQEVGSDSESVAEAAAVDTERVESLISQLADASFAVRQQATRELWGMGAGILSELESAAENASRGEARVRLNDLILFAKCGIGPSTSEEIVQCVSGFLEQESIVQRNSLSKLKYLEQEEVVERLLGLLDKERRKEFEGEFSSLVTAREALLDGDFAKFDQWLEQARENKAHRTFFFYTHWVRGDLDAEIKLLEEQAKPEIEAGKKYRIALEESKDRKSKDELVSPNQDTLRELIGLLRFQKRVEEALQYSRLIVDMDRRRQLTHVILMENGRWGQIQKLMASSEEIAAAQNEEEGGGKLKDGLAIEAEGHKRALIEFFAMDDKACGETLTQIEKDLKEKDDFSHSSFLQYKMDRERADKFQKLEKNYETFSLLTEQNRYEKLFELFELQTVDKRMKFFQDRLADAQALKPKFNLLNKVSSTERRRLNSERGQLRDYYLEAAVMLDTLGFGEEAEFHLRNLFFSELNESLNVELQVAAALLELCAFESAWEIARIHFDRTGSDIVFRSLLGTGSRFVPVLNQQLETQVPDISERFQLIAKMIKSPAALEPYKDVDIWQEFDRWGIEIHSSFEQELFRIWQVEDEIDAPEPVMGQLVPASVNHYIANREFLQAAQVLETSGRRTEPAIYAQAAWVYEKAGRKDRARIMQLLFMSQYKITSSYSTLLRGFEKMQFRRYAFDAVRLHDCLNYDTYSRNIHPLMRLCSSSEDDDETNPFEEMVRTQIFRFNSRVRYLSGYQDASFFVKGHLAKGDLAAAKYWFRKQLNFQTVDSTLCESVFPMMIESGETELVDELFEEAAKGFYSILSKYPESSLYLNNYAWICSKARKNLDNAIELSRRSIEHRPVKSGQYDTLAELYFATGDYDKAIKTIQRAIEINPTREYYQRQLKKFQLKSKARQ